ESRRLRRRSFRAVSRAAAGRGGPEGSSASPVFQVEARPGRSVGGQMPPSRPALKDYASPARRMAAAGRLIAVPSAVLDTRVSHSSLSQAAALALEGDDISALDQLAAAGPPASV